MVKSGHHHSRNSSTASQRLTALIVEDNAEDLEYYQDLLQDDEDWSLKLLRATCLSSAEEILKDEKVDVILLDLSLPDAQGLAGLGLLKNKFPQVPILVLTPLEDKSMGVEALRHGAQNFLVKDQLTKIQLERAMIYSIERQKQLTSMKGHFDKERATVKKLETMRSIARNISRQLDFRKLLNSILISVSKALRADAGSIMLANKQEGVLEVVASMGSGDLVVRGAKVKLGSSVAGKVLERKEAEILTDGLDSWKYPSFVPKERAIFSGLSVPILEYSEDGQSSQAMGVINLNRIETREHFSDEDKDFLMGLSYQIANAVMNSRAYEIQIANVRRLEALDQMRSDFISAVTHEFRTPLVSIKGYTQMLLTHGGRMEDKDRESALKKVQANSKRLERLVDQVLTVAKIEQGVLNMEFQLLDFGRLAEEVSASLSGAYSHHNIVVENAARGQKATADPMTMEQVLLNLLSNALKYSPQGGEVRVRVCVVGDQLRVLVTDQGLGIPPEDQERIFEKFGRVQADSHKGIEGTGMGLYMVRQIMHRHDGEITLESEPGQGSTFTLHLPLKREASLGRR